MGGWSKLILFISTKVSINNQEKGKESLFQNSPISVILQESILNTFYGKIKLKKTSGKV
jgi:hypothetical protein